MLAGDFGHGLVGNDGVKTIRIRSEDIQGHESAGAGRHGISQVMEKFLTHFRNHFLIVDEEDMSFFLAIPTVPCRVTRRKMPLSCRVKELKMSCRPPIGFPP